MEISPDMYEYLTNFADDKTILSMLSVNKKFNDDIFFERVMRRKYPLIVRFKKETQSWKEFFLHMVYYIFKIEEEFGVPYIPVKTYNPDYNYKRMQNIKEYTQEKIREFEENLKSTIYKSKAISYKEKIERHEARMNKKIYDMFFNYAKRSGRKDIIDLLYEKLDDPKLGPYRLSNK